MRMSLRTELPNRTWRRLAVGLIALVFSLQSNAQHVDSTGEQFRILQSEVSDLRAQQEKVLAALAELNRLVTHESSGSASPVPLVVTDVSGERFRGDSSATVVLIEYGDFECIFCRRFERDTYPQIRDSYIIPSKLRFYFRDLPLPNHSFAMPSAMAADCAAEQGKYWPMHDELFTGELQLTSADIDQHGRNIELDLNKLSSCIKSDRYINSIQSSMENAAKFGVSGTPSFIVGTLENNGTTVKITKIIEGAKPFGEFKTALDLLLSENDATSSTGDKKKSAALR